MSSTYGKNKKELSGVKVVSAAEVWRKNYKNGKFSLRKDIDILGKVEKSDRPNIGRSGEGAYVFSLAFLPLATRVHRSFPLRALAKMIIA